MKPRLLVADADAEALDQAAGLAETLGHPVLRVQDLSTVLPTAAKERPALILHRQDHRTEVARIVAGLRVDEATAETPVLFYGARGAMGERQARYDAHGHLAWPLDIDDLEAAIAAALHPRKAEEPASEVRRTVRSTFHDYLNLLAALGNYVQVLDAARKPPAAEAAVHGLDELALKLEAKTDRLRAALLAAVDFLEGAAAPAEGRGPAVARAPVPGPVRAAAHVRKA